MKTVIGALLLALTLAAVPAVAQAPPQPRHFLINDTFGGKKVTLEPVRTAQVGTAIFRDFVLPFEVVSVLLLAALVGAVAIARRD